ncbi:hypothetical protein ACF061_10805 [Streptomyces sp. NPDC015220]|uniref:hypothetical protein n=1 Tax=Streptomyces sp. NPDC015220 TaxID=3364947 RepID=UPI0036FBD9EE
MASDVTCEKLREIGAELALDVLPGRERAGAVAHLEQCADCRERIRQLTEVGDRLVGLLPGSEPPVGFETRVAQTLTRGAAGAADEGRLTARITGRAHAASRRRRVRPRIAAAATALALAVGFGGWSVGTAIEDTLASPSPPATNQATSLLWGGLMSARGQTGKEVGEVYADPGHPGWVFMTVDLAGTGASYNGEVTCLLVRRDGSTSRVGTFSLRDGAGSWGAVTQSDRSTLAGARLTAPDGTVLATTRFGTGAES